MNKSGASFEADGRLAAVVNSIDDAFYVLDRDWRFVLLNDAAETMLGASRSRILGMSLWEFYPDGKQSRFAPLLARAMDHGVPGRMTGPSELSRGRFVDFRVKPLGGDGLGVSIVDVTDRTLAERAMQESRERLDLAVAAHRIGIFDWHVPSGRIVWSRELEAIFGLEPGGFEGTAEAFQRRVLAEDLDAALADTEAALRAGRDRIPFSFRIRRPDGAIRWIEGVSQVVYAEDKTPKRIVGTNFDVTERFLAEQEIRASRERLDLAVGAHNIGIFDLDVASGRVLWNPELEVIFGLPPGGFEGHFDDFRRRALPEDVAELQAKTDAALAERRDVVDYAYRILRPDGEIRWLEGRARVVYGGDGAPERVVGTIMDVTERKAAEQHQRLLVNELNHRVKNTLAIVQAITWQSFRSGGMTLRAREAFEGRLTALAAAHDVITRQNWEAGSIDRIIKVAVAPHDPGDGRLAVSGPPVALEPKSAVALAMAMHELATNAVKYGALSTADGRVDVCWTADRSFLRLTWCETGGPPVVEPIERGFGARLLERGLAEDLHGEVRLEFRPTGVLCAVEAQLAA